MLRIDDEKFPHRYPLIPFPSLEKLKKALFKGEEITLTVKTRFTSFDLGRQDSVREGGETVGDIFQRFREEIEREETTSGIEREVLGGPDQIELPVLIHFVVRSEDFQPGVACVWLTEGRAFVGDKRQEVRFRAILPDTSYGGSGEIVTDAPLV
jgi:hypothetical protein